MRAFEFNDGKSNKFWKIELEGKSFTVTFGRVGTSGQAQTKEFPSEEKSRAAHDKLVAEKAGKGYVETTAGKASATPSSGKALENAIFANPDDLGAHAAYADWLIEQGDPRGEFIQVQLALEDAKKSAKERKELEKREQELLKKHEREWLGELAAYLIDQKRPAGPEWHKPEAIKSSWGRGWLSDLHIPEIFVDLARALAKSVHARMIRHLIIEQVAYVSDSTEYARDAFEPGPDVPAGETYPGLHPLLQAPSLGGMRVFQLGELEGVEESMNCHTSGETALDLIKKMPNIEELYLLAHRVGLKSLFGLKSLQNLRVLQVYHVTGKHPLAVLAKNSAVEKLTHLLIHPHAYDFDEDDEDGGAYINLAGVKALVQSPHLKGLTHLRLRLNDMGDKGINEIIQSGILKRLKVLDIQGGCVTDAGAQSLAASSDLKSLELLNISKNMLTKAGIDALKKAKVKLEAADQHKPVPPGEDQEREYLWEGDIE